MKVSNLCFFALLLSLSLFSACSLELEIANATNGPLVLAVDGGQSEVVASGKSLKKTLEGPSRAVKVTGYGSYLEDFSTNYDLSTSASKKVVFVANLSRLRVQNASGQIVSGLYLAPGQSSYWTTNLGPIASGSNTEFRLAATNWDLMTVTAQVATTLNSLDLMLDKTLTVNLNPDGTSRITVSSAPFIFGLPPREMTIP